PGPARPAARAPENWLLRRWRAGDPAGPDGAGRGARDRRRPRVPGGALGRGQRPQVGGDRLPLAEAARILVAEGGSLRTRASPGCLVAGGILPPASGAPDLSRPPDPGAEDE